MAGRTFVLVLALAFVALFAFLTVNVLITQGFDILVALALVVLAALAFGALGALGSSDDE